MIFSILSLPLLLCHVGSSARWGIWMFHICIYISISIYLLINFSICEANPKRFQNSRSDKVTAQHLLSCFVVGEIKLPWSWMICSRLLWALNIQNYISYFPWFSFIWFHSLLYFKSDTGWSGNSDWFSQAKNKMKLYLLYRQKCDSSLSSSPPPLQLYACFETCFSEAGSMVLAGHVTLHQRAKVCWLNPAVPRLVIEERLTGPEGPKC